MGRRLGPAKGATAGNTESDGSKLHIDVCADSKRYLIASHPLLAPQLLLFTLHSSSVVCWRRTAELPSKVLLMTA